VVVLERRKRKGPVLSASSIPCLRHIPTINITEGCAHGCAYCYTQGYSGYPGAGRVVLYENLPELVEAELRRKRKRPRRVYFSPSSDAFQPLPEVQEITYQTMSILLQAGVEVAFLTKGAVDERFLTVFSHSPAKVFAQIGIASLCERVWKTLEGGAASPRQRLESIENLTGLGVVTTARLDPLIPDLTDTEASLEPLLAELARRNVRAIAASYLFVRPAFAQRLADCMRVISPSSPPVSDWPWQEFANGVGGGRVIDMEERRRRFAHLAALSRGYGIALHVCTCKNPGLGRDGGCQIAGPPYPTSLDGFPLFGRE